MLLGINILFFIIVITMIIIAYVELKLLNDKIDEIYDTITEMIVADIKNQ